MAEPTPVKEGSGLSIQKLTHEYREESKNARIKRLRKLARMDFKMLGGVSPLGFSGGGGDGARPTSMAGRT